VKRPFLCSVLLALFLAPDRAAAVEIAIDDTTIELIAPTDYCALDRDDWPESGLVDFTSEGIKRQGERLAYFVQCEQARSWHKGDGSTDAGEAVDYQASLNFRGQDVTSAMLKELCATLRKGDDSSKGWLDIFLRAFKGAMKGRYGGAEDTTLAYVVFGHETTGCYIFSSSMMKNREQVYTVSALTSIKGRLVAAHRSRRFGAMDLVKGNAEDVIKHLLTASRETATALIAANQ
jgi:hypothetical protein